MDPSPAGATPDAAAGDVIDVFLADDNLIVREGVRALIAIGTSPWSVWQQTTTR